MELVAADEVAGSGWLGFDWTDWALLDPGSKRLRSLPPTPGFLRIKKVNADHLDYVGQTGRSLHDRVNHLANKVQADERPDSSRSSAEHLWELKEAGGRFEVSVANPTIARSETDRIGIENVLFAVHLRARGHSPSVNLDRVLDEAPAPDWDAREMTGEDWLGLDWTEPRDLADRTSIDAAHVVYRIWFPGFVPPLAYIGKSTNVANRLIKHEKKFGPDARFSVAPLDQHHLKDIEAACLADHYLQTNTLPKGQNGRRNRFSWGD